MQKHSKKIAYIGQKGIPALWGGVERATEELAVRMVRSGYHVTAYCRRWYTKGLVENYQGIDLVHVPSIHTKHLDTISHTFFATIHAMWTGADIIHFQGIGPALLAWMPRVFAPRTQVLVTFHCLDRRLSKWNFIARAAFWFGEYIAMHAAHEVFVTSRFLQDYSYEVWGRIATYLPNGVFEIAEGEADSHETLAAFGLQPEEYILCVGRLMPDKAQHELIESFIRLKKRTEPEFAKLKLVLVGEAALGDNYAESLREQAAGRTDIIFTGVQTGAPLKTLMRFARVAAQPSYSEGMPLAVLEVASFGVPLVLSNIPAHREIFGEMHVYNTVGDLDRLSRDLERNVVHYEEVRAVALAHARRIQEQYRWELIAARYHVALVALETCGSLEGQSLLRNVRARA